MTMEINTNGGDIHSMNSIISYIERPNMNIYGFVSGYAYSAGIFILRACDLSFAAESASLMFHDICTSTEGPLKAVKQENKHTRKQANQIIKRFAKKTGHSAKWWKDNSYFNPLNETLMTPKQALKLGVIDHIGVPVLSVKAKKKLKVTIV